MPDSPLSNGSLLGVVVQNPRMEAVVARIASSIGQAVTFRIGWNEPTMLKAGQELLDEGAQALLARGPWTDTLREATKLPTLDYNPDAADFLRILTQARGIANTVGIIDVYNHGEEWRAFEEALGIRLVVYSDGMSPDKDVTLHLEELIHRGAEVVVGGEMTVRCARKLSIPALYLETGTLTIKTALLKAQETLRGIEAEKERAHVLQTVLDNVEEGIVAFSQDGVVIAGNRAAEELAAMQISPGTRCSEFPAPWNSVDSWIAHGSRPAEKISSVQGKKVLFRFFPVRVADQVSSSIVMSHEVHKVQSTEAYIRRSLDERGFVARYTLDQMVAESREMKNAIEVARRYSRTDGSILLLGETGSGKEMVAQGIHCQSPRAKGPFVAINCAALPETLLESELFGYEEGAFTGAKKGGKPGLLEIAHGGTVFLDEISSTSPAVQVRLLRVLEERSVVRLGGDAVLPVVFRLITACDEKLLRAASCGAFRADLFFRIAVLVVRIPPLRKRQDDIEPLLRYFMGLGPERHLPFSSKIMQRLKAYSWPGNVRELRNFSESFAVLKDMYPDPDEAAMKALETYDLIAHEDLPEDPLRDNDMLTVPPGNLDDMLGSLLAQFVEKRMGRSLAAIASELGMSKSGLWKMLRRYNVCGQTHEGWSASED